MKKSRLIRKILGIALVFVLIGGMLGGLPALVSRVEASPATIYVPDDYPTIQAAVDAASPGDTIIVLPGTYSENVHINKENLTIQSRDGADETIVQAAFKVMALNVNVNGFTIKGGIFGVETFGNTVVRSSILCDNAWGIYLGSSSNNTIENNKFFNNRIADIDLRWSGNNLIKNCSFDLGLYIRGDYENKVESCTVGGKPLVFLNGERDKVIMKEPGQVILFKCMNVTVKECVFSNRAVGVELLQCTGCIVENNTFTYNPSRSIELFNSSDNVIQNNICRLNTGGIYLQYSSNNLVQGNKCSDSYDWQRAGIGVLYSSNNIIRNNTCSGNVIGILVEKSLGNAIYSNNLVNNGHNAFSDGSVGIWNSPEEMNYTYKGNTYTNYLGNYWSDYTGSDADGDGIGDTPYPIYSDADNYPLVEPFENYAIGEDTVETGVEVGLGSTALSSQRKLVATSDGHLHVVYHREDGNGILQIYHAESSDGGATWSEEPVTNNASNNQCFPALAIDSNDNLHLVWQDGLTGLSNQGNVQVWYKMKTTSWGDSQLLSTYAAYASIAIDSLDNCHVVYGGYSDYGGWYSFGNGVRWREKSAEGWQSEMSISQSEAWVRAPAIAIDGNNSIHIAWLNAPRYLYYDIHYRVRTSTGWGSEVEVNAETDNALGGYPSITTDSSNHAHIVWQHGSGSDYTIKYREYTTSLQPTVDLEGPTTYMQYNPVIATDSNDHIHVVWSGQHSGSPTDYQLRYREYTTSWQPIENLTSSSSANQTNPNLMWASYPVIGGIKTNQPDDGYAFVWMDGTTIKYFENYGIGGDTTSPSVSSLSPEDDDTDVLIDTVVTATFSEPMDTSTITTDSFILAGSAVSGTVTYNPATYTATFTPDANLDYNHTYTATLSTAITDLAGNPLAEACSWSFTTEPSPRVQFDFSNLQGLFVFPWSGKIREVEFVDEKSEYSPGDTVRVRVKMENTGIGDHKYSVKLRILDPAGEMVYSEEKSSDEYVHQGESLPYGPFEYTLPKKFWPWEKDAMPGEYHVLANLSAKFAGAPEDSWIVDLIPSFTVDYLGIDTDLAPPEVKFRVTGDEGGGHSYKDGEDYKNLAEEIRNFRKTTIPVCIPIEEDAGEAALVLAINPLEEEPIAEEYEKAIVRITIAEETWSTLEEVAPSSFKQVDLYASTPASLSGSVKTFFARLYTKFLPNVWEQLINDVAWDIVKSALGWGLPPFLEDIFWPGLKGRYETIVREGANWGKSKQNILYLPVNTPITLSANGGIVVTDPSFLLPIHQVLNCIAGQQQILIPEDPAEYGIRTIEISLSMSMSKEDLIKALENVIQAKIASPGELRVYDSQDRVTGSVSGEVKQEIPISAYDAENCMVTVFSAIDSYCYEIVGAEEGTYGLEVVFIKEGEAITFAAADIPTSPNAIHQYTINWDALSQGEEGVTVRLDYDGDGTFEETITSDGELSHDEFALQTATTIDFDPDTLNLKDKGKYVTVYIELPPGYNVTQIDISSIRLNDTVPALPKPTQRGDYDKDGIPDMMVKFDRAALKSLLAPGDQVEITITGNVSEIGFQGTDTIRVIKR